MPTIDKSVKTPDRLGSNSDRVMSLKNCGQGRILLIVANGPGHTEAALDKLKDHSRIDVMAINRPDSRVWPPRFWAFTDETQAGEHRELLGSYDGLVLNSGAVRTHHKNAIIFKGARLGFQTDIASRGAHVGGTTSHFAMQLALWMGYEHVYIFGLDMSRGADGKLYSWGSNKYVADEKREAKFKGENRTLDAAGRIMGEENRKRFTICSQYATEKKWSFLRHFESVDHNTAVDLILSRHPRPLHRPGKSPITLVTCTGGRPEAFALCEQWMKRAMERIDFDVEWIVVDDCEAETVTTMAQRVIRPSDRWQPGMNTQSRNMITGLSAAKHDRIFIIEDDDWYAPEYLAEMAPMLDQFGVIGEGLARYYNVRERRWRLMRNRAWAAACQTALRSDFIPVLEKRLIEYHGFDIKFWFNDVKDEDKHLFFGKHLVVGIKGMPGRPGAASGHKPNSQYASDLQLMTLKHWVGEDAEVYRQFYSSPIRSR